MSTATAIAVPNSTRASSAVTMIPQFPSRDLAATRAFYQSLGFTCGLHLDDETDGFLIMGYRLDDAVIELHFWPWPDVDPAASIMSAYLRFPDLVTMQACHAGWSAADLSAEGVPRLTAPVARPWGMTEFYLVDPEGTLLKCGTHTPGT